MARLNFSSFSRRPLFLAVLAGAAMVYLAIYKFNIPATEVGQAALISFVVVLGVALPAGLLVALIKLIKHLGKKE